MRVTIARVPRPNVAQLIDVPEGISVGEVVRRMGAMPDQVVVLRDGAPLPLDASVRPDDVLQLVNVFSGG